MESGTRCSPSNCASLLAWTSTCRDAGPTNYTLWLAYQGKLVKASPERIRRASAEEQITLTGWIDDLVHTGDLFEKTPKRGFLDITSNPLPPEEEFEAIDNVWQSKRRAAPFVVSHLSHYCGQFLCVSSLCSGHVNRSCTDWKSFTPRLRFALRTDKKICTPRQCSTMSMGEIFLIHKPLFTEATPGFLVFLVDNYVIEHCVFILALSVPP